MELASVQSVSTDSSCFFCSNQGKSKIFFRDSSPDRFILLCREHEEGLARRLHVFKYD
jgi:hypothetical protein